MTKRKPTIFDLMAMTGGTLILCAIPAGLAFSFQKQPGVQSDLHWQIIIGCVTMAAIGITGGVLLWIGRTALRRRSKRDKLIHDDMA